MRPVGLFHLSALYQITAGTKNWGETSYQKSFARLLPLYQGGLIPFTDKVRRLAVYGGGRIGCAFLDVTGAFLEEHCGQVVVLDAAAKEGGMLAGYPVYPPEYAAEYQPDTVVIASTRFPEEMEAVIRPYLSSEARICRLPESWRHFIW